MCSGGAKYVSAHGHNIPDLLEAILKLVPLDTYNFSKYMILYLITWYDLEMVRSKHRVNNFCKWTLFFRSCSGNGSRQSWQKFGNGGNLIYFLLIVKHCKQLISFLNIYFHLKHSINLFSLRLSGKNIKLFVMLPMEKKLIFYLWKGSISTREQNRHIVL